MVVLGGSSLGQGTLAPGVRLWRSVPSSCSTVTSGTTVATRLEEGMEGEVSEGALVRLASNLLFCL